MYKVKWRIMKQEKKYPLADHQDQNIISESYIAWGLPDAAAKISEGLHTDILATIQNRLNLSNHELADLLLISPRTLDRRKKESVLPSDESERSYRIARLTDLAFQIFGSKEKAAKWFNEPNYALGNKKPIELVKTEPGARLVENTLGRIRYGVTV